MKYHESSVTNDEGEQIPVSPLILHLKNEKQDTIKRN